MIGKNLHHHFFPHIHEDPPSSFKESQDFGRAGGEPKQHPAHLVSLVSLFLYLQLFLVFGAGIYVIRIAAPTILGQASFGTDAIISLTNAKRAANGLPALTYNAQLASAAAGKASNMLAENYWAHNSPSGKTPWTFITGSGYRYLYAGENLARDFSDAGSVVDAWMNSPSHRSNILDKNFSEIGVSVNWGNLTGREGTLVVQMFGTKVFSAQAQAQPAASPVAAASPKAQASPASAGAKTSKPNPTATPEASPQASVSPTPEATPVAVAQAPSGQEVSVLASNKFAISKFASMILVALVFLIFSIEVVVSAKREYLTLRSTVIAHLLILGFVLFALWYALGGAVI